MTKQEPSQIIMVVISSLFSIVFWIAIFFPYCKGEILSIEEKLSFSGIRVILDTFAGKYTATDGFPITAFPLIIVAGFLLSSGITSFYHVKRYQRISRESQVMLVIMMRFLYVLGGILGLIAVIFLHKFKNSIYGLTGNLTFSYYYVTILFGFAILVGVPRLFMKITFQDEVEEYVSGIRNLAKLIVYENKMENYEGELKQEVFEQLKQYEEVSLFDEILKLLGDSSRERNELKIIAQPFIHSLDVETLKKCSSNVANIGNPIKRSSAEKLVEIIAKGLLKKKELKKAKVSERKLAKEKLLDKAVTGETEGTTARTVKKERKLEVSEITKKDIEIVRKLIKNEESVEIQWIENETGMSKTKIKLIALELNLEIKFGKLVRR